MSCMPLKGGRHAVVENFNLQSLTFLLSYGQSEVKLLSRLRPLTTSIAII